MEHSDNTHVYVYDVYIDLLKTLCQVEKKNKHKVPHTVGYYLYKMFTTGKSMETKSRFMVSRGWGREA